MQHTTYNINGHQNPKLNNSNNNDKFHRKTPLQPAGMSPAADPLLPESNSKSVVRHATLYGAVFNVSTSIIGAGIMSIPATLNVIGVVPAFVLIAIIAWLAEVSVGILMRYTKSGETVTYAGVMGESFGRVGSVAVQICVLITNLGCLIVYLIIIGDVLTGKATDGGGIHLGVLQEWFGFQWWNSRESALLFIIGFVMLPLVLYRKLESLRYSSAIAVLLAVIFVGICSAMAISALINGKTNTPKLIPHLDNNTSFFQLFTAVPVIVTAFTFHFNVHPIGFELPSPSDMITATRISMILCAAIYFFVGLFGYLLFGDSINADILVNFDQASGSEFGPVVNDIVRLSYALHLMLVFPLLNFSLRANIHEMLFSSKRGNDNTRFVCLTFGLLLFSYLAAIAFPDIWYFFQFLGSTSAVCLAFIFPGAIVIRDIHGISTSGERVFSWLMIILAIVTSVFAISTNIYSLVSHRS